MSQKMNTGGEDADYAPRRRARLAAVQALYQIAATGAGAESVIGEFIRLRLSETGKEAKASDRHEPEELALAGEAVDTALFAAIVRAADARKADIDRLLQGALEPQWSIARLEWPLQSVLRAGVAELLTAGDIPAPVIINDYMNVAHAFFSGKEPGLVNGVLDKIAKSVRG